MPESRHHLRALDRIARAGYAARGAVYVIVGGLTLLAAFGMAQKTDTEGAIRTLFDQPMGTALVWLLVGGLAGHVVWRIVQTLFDADDHGTGPKGLLVRSALLVSAATHAALALYALSLLGVAFTGGEGGGGGFASTAARFVGSLAVTAVLAIAFAGAAIAHWIKAFSGGYAKFLDADARTMTKVGPVCAIGLAARGIVFAVVAWLLAARVFRIAGEDASPPDLMDVMDYFETLPGGKFLLAGLGAGLFAFALYSFALARWRRLRVAAIHD
ncbi:DUF1206 domain-containing protein [Methylobrevis pamukkalensis]|uniref:DUF1206 domain-containing protein n=1 Tax=Methylobrevis pamukkalensis TaxID=1439726 RepID=UPI00084625FA|nr:DUF1206 domain-containing protein [Methylobrevis pamukkalensis]